MSRDQIFLESQSERMPLGEIMGREGIYSADLAHIHKKLKEGVLECLSK